MPAFTTPDVYVREIKVFPPSVAEVETAVPAFIGYTETATRDATNDLILKPIKIYSMTDFEHYFGGPHVRPLAVAVTTRSDGGKDSELLTTPSPDPDYLLYHCMKMFFDNGGGQCYVVCVGLYQGTATWGLTGNGGSDPTTAYGLRDGLDAVAREDEPTLLVIPESVKLSYADYGTLASAMLLQCFTLGDRFAILDPIGGDTEPGEDISTPGLTPATTEVIEANRDAWAEWRTKVGVRDYRGTDSSTQRREQDWWRQILWLRRAVSRANTRCADCPTRRHAAQNAAGRSTPAIHGRTTTARQE